MDRSVSGRLVSGTSSSVWLWWVGGGWGGWCGFGWHWLVVAWVRLPGDAGVGEAAGGSGAGESAGAVGGGTGPAGGAGSGVCTGASESGLGDGEAGGAVGSASVAGSVTCSAVSPGAGSAVRDAGRGRGGGRRRVSAPGDGDDAHSGDRGDGGDRADGGGLRVGQHEILRPAEQQQQTALGGERATRAGKVGGPGHAAEQQRSQQGAEIGVHLGQLEIDRHARSALVEVLLDLAGEIGRAHV